MLLYEYAIILVDDTAVAYWSLIPDLYVFSILCAVCHYQHSSSSVLKSDTMSSVLWPNNIPNCFHGEFLQTAFLSWLLC